MSSEFSCRVSEIIDVRITLCPHRRKPENPVSVSCADFWTPISEGTNDARPIERSQAVEPAAVTAPALVPVPVPVHVYV